MKTNVLILAMAMALTTLVSCKKDYTCKCSKVYTDSTGSVSVNDGSYIFKDNEARAADKCNQQESTGSDLRGNYSRECDI